MFGKVITCEKEFFLTLILCEEEVAMSSKKDAKDANKSPECSTFLSPEVYKARKGNPAKNQTWMIFLEGLLWKFAFLLS